MKKIPLIFVLLVAHLAYSQAVRVDPIPSSTTNGLLPGGQYPPLLVVPGTIVTLCGYPANGFPCTNFAASYTNAAMGTACTSGNPVVLNGSQNCQSTTDNQGKFGFWVTSGNYTYMLRNPQTSQLTGPFFFSAGGSGGGGSSAFSAITPGTNTLGSMIVGTGSSLSASGSGTIVATSAPYSGLTGSAPIWNQNTTGNAATATVAASVPYSGLTGTVPTWNQNTTGNAATATLAATATAAVTAGTKCSAGQAPTGVDVNWNAVGCASISGIHSINGDTTSAQVLAASGSGLTVVTAAGTTTYTLAGGGLTGSITSGGPLNDVAYPAGSAGTIVGPASNSLTLPLAQSTSQINTVLATKNIRVHIQAGDAHTPFDNSTWHDPIVDDRPDVPVLSWNVKASGAQCDAAQKVGTFSSTSKTVTGYSASAADALKIVIAVAPVGGVPTSFISTVASVSGGQLVLTSTPPFSESNWIFTLGHDDKAALADALSFGHTSAEAISLPDGNCLSSTTQRFNGEQIVGLGTDQSYLTGPPGMDTLAADDPSVITSNTRAWISYQQSGLFTVNYDAEIDATQPWTQCTDSAGCVAQVPMYRPLGIAGPDANNPVSPQWIQGTGAYNAGAINGVANVSNGSTTDPTVICVPSTGSIPAATQQIIFPYQAVGTAMFSTTVVNATGAGCGTGFTGITLTAGWPGATITGPQYLPIQEWFAGTSIQNIATPIPAASGRTVGSGTAWSSSGGNLTLTVANNYIVGQTVIISNPATTAALNTVQLTIASRSGSSITGPTTLATGSGTETFDVNAFPMIVTLANSIVPTPESTVAGLAPFGYVQIDAEQCSYYGNSNYPARATATPSITLTACAQGGTTAAAHAASAQIFALNPLKPAWPWPVPAGAVTAPLTAAANASGGSTVYTGTFPAGASNAYAGQRVSILGFTTSANNISGKLITASTTTTITVSNASGVAETDPATVKFFVTTPTTAEFYPAMGAGNQAISWAVYDGSYYSGNEGPLNVHLHDITMRNWPGGISSPQNKVGYQVQNDTGCMYSVPLFFASKLTNLSCVDSFYGLTEGTPSINTWGYFSNGFPTANGNIFSGWFGQDSAYPLITIGGQNDQWINETVFSQSAAPPNNVWPGFPIGYSGAQAIWLQDGPLSDIGAIKNKTGMEYAHFPGFYVEAETTKNTVLYYPAGETLALTQPVYLLNCNGCVYTDFQPQSGGTTFVGGTNMIFNGGNLQVGFGIPLVNYGTNNIFNSVYDTSTTFYGNTWGSNSFLNLGHGTVASSPAYGASGPNMTPLAGNSARVSTGQTAEMFADGNTAFPFTDTIMGFIRPEEFNTGSQDVFPMSIGWTFDDTAPVTHAYAACNVTTGGGCSTYQWEGGGRVYIGPDQRLVAAPYQMYTTFKGPSADTFTFTVTARDDGHASCSAGTVYTGTQTMTGAWQTVSYPVDWTGHAGCVLNVAYTSAASAATIETSYIDFSPIPANVIAKQFTTSLSGTPVCISSGSGAPSGAPTQPNGNACAVGSTYSNTSGSLGSLLYVWTGSTWSNYK